MHVFPDISMFASAVADLAAVQLGRLEVQIACLIEHKPVPITNGQLVLKLLQLPGKKAMQVSEILRGHPDLFKVGDQLEQPAC